MNAFGNEFNFLVSTTPNQVDKVSGVEIADLRQLLRENALKIDPGHDGLYGRIVSPSSGARITRKVALDSWTTVDDP